MARSHLLSSAVLSIFFSIHSFLFQVVDNVHTVLLLSEYDMLLPFMLTNISHNNIHK